MKIYKKNNIHQIHLAVFNSKKNCSLLVTKQNSKVQFYEEESVIACGKIVVIAWISI